MTSSLAAYYAEKDLFPSHRALDGVAALDAHERGRSALLESHLKLPRGLFAGARMAEFGPDTGENALVFARWGAQMTLVEPNRSAHPIIQNYFEKFELKSHLEHLSQGGLEDYEGEPFDFVNAEGFVAAITPSAKWIGALKRLTRPGGLAHISYFERRGALIELATNAAVRAVAALQDRDPAETAEDLLETKWRTVAHTRSLSAWFHDHFDSPAARLGAMLSASGVMREMTRADFRLHASAPGYADPHWVGWPKRERESGEETRSSIEHLNAACLSHVLGRKAYWAGPYGGGCAWAAAIDEAARLADGVVAAPDAPEKITALGRVLYGMGARLDSESRFFITDTELSGPSAMLKAFGQALLTVADGDAGLAEIFFRGDREFLQCWGAPVHHAVFRKAVS